MEKKVWSGRQRSATARKAATPETHLIHSINAAQSALVEPSTADKRAVLHLPVPTALPQRKPEDRQHPDKRWGEAR